MTMMELVEAVEEQLRRGKIYPVGRVAASPDCQPSETNRSRRADEW